MPYNQELAERIRLLNQESPLGEKIMFGGIGYFLDGNIACGVIGDELIVRVGPEAFEEALLLSGARVFDFTGKPTTGWVKVLPDGIQRDQDLREWINRGKSFAVTLPPK